MDRIASTVSFSYRRVDVFGSGVDIFVYWVICLCIMGHCVQEGGKAYGGRGILYMGNVARIGEVGCDLETV